MIKPLKKIRQDIFTTSIVSEPRGSWKYQDAYSRTTYGVKRRKDGGLMLWAMGGTKKYSKPQLRRNGIKADMEGGQHRRDMTAATVQDMYIRAVLRMGQERADRAARLIARMIPGALAPLVQIGVV